MRFGSTGRMQTSSKNSHFLFVLFTPLALLFACAQETPPPEVGSIAVQRADDAEAVTTELDAFASWLYRIDLNDDEHAGVELTFGSDKNRVTLELQYDSFRVLAPRTELRDNGNWTPNDQPSDVSLQRVNVGDGDAYGSEWEGTIEIDDSSRMWSSGSFDLVSRDGDAVSGAFVVARDREHDTDDCDLCEHVSL
jgi:hypothetical protein